MNGEEEKVSSFIPFTAKKYIRRRGSRRMFIREKKVDCLNYSEVDIISRTEKGDKAVKGKRGKKVRVSEPKQKDLNDKNAKRYLVQLGNGNFGKGDLHTSATYNDKFLPETVEEAEKEIINYLRRVDYRRKMLGLEPLKYILVTEYKFTKDGECIKRIHHHIFMNGGLSREEVEILWTKERINWKRYEKDRKGYINSIELMGYINADRMQTNEFGIEGLCKYIVKDPQGKKRWSSSRNLDRPCMKAPNDKKYTAKKVEALAKSPDAGRSFFEKKYKNYDIVSIEPTYYQETGWHIYLRMWKKQAGSRDRP